MLKIGLMEAVRTELKGNANFEEMKGFREALSIFLIRCSCSWGCYVVINCYHSPQESK